MANIATRLTRDETVDDFISYGTDFGDRHDDMRDFNPTRNAVIASGSDEVCPNVSARPEGGAPSFQPS